MNEAADFKSAVSTYFTTQAKLQKPINYRSFEIKKLPVKELIECNFWRRGPESNRASRICNPVHNRFVTAPFIPLSYRRTLQSGQLLSSNYQQKRTAAQMLSSKTGAGEESRTLDLNLGKVALYQLSYSRVCTIDYSAPLIRRP